MNSKMNYVSHSEQDTAALAARLAPTLRRGDVLCLYGNLGSGKTLFTRALIRTLCGDPQLQVPSPTFTLVQIYESSGPGGDPWGGQLFHFDLYRIESAEEVFELGWEEAISDAITVIEWPERLGGLAPAARLDVTFTPVENRPDDRHISFVAYGDICRRLSGFWEEK